MPLKISLCEKLIKISEELVYINDTIFLKMPDKTGIDPTGELRLVYESYSLEDLSDEVIYLCDQLDKIIQCITGGVSDAK